MHVKLIVVEGQARQREIEVELPAWIGRSRAAAVTIGDSKVSRQHCELYEQDGVLMVRDNDSMNGTCLDGDPIEGIAVVEPGAKLTVGPLTLMAVYEPSGAPAAAEPAATGEPDFAAFLDPEEDAPSEGPDDETVGWLPSAAGAPVEESLFPPTFDAEPADPQPEAEAAHEPPAAQRTPQPIAPDEEVPIAEPATDDPPEVPGVPVPEPAEPAPAASEEQEADLEDESDEEYDVDDEALGDFFKGLP